MRLLFIFLVSLGALANRVYSQTLPLTKLYLFNPYPRRDLQPAATPGNFLRFGSSIRVGYALIETDMDSLGFIAPSGQTVYLILESGKTYYYGFEYNIGAYKETTANAFWLSVATVGKQYSHYSITKKSGITKIE